jgi:choline-sulfatase
MTEWGYEYAGELGGTVSSELMDDSWTELLAEKKLLDGYRKSISEFQRANRGFVRRPWEDPPAPLPVEYHIDSYTGRQTMQWIADYDQSKPFYLQVLFPGPHPPFNSPAEYRSLYKPESLPIGIMDTLKPPVSKLVDFVKRWSNLDGMTTRQKQQLLTCYYAKITLIDEQIGGIVKALEQKGLLDNTWIIYSSDHGEMAGDHKLSHKIVFLEGALNVPLIVRPPKGIEGRRCTQLTDHFDLVATLLDIAGADPLTHCEGRSLLPRIKGSPEGGEVREKERVFSEVAGYSMVRTNRFKLVVDSKTRRSTELYDLQEDPHELINLVDNENYADQEELLNSYLDELLKDMDEEKYASFLKKEKARPPHMQRI